MYLNCGIPEDPEKINQPHGITKVMVYMCIKYCLFNWSKVKSLTLRSYLISFCIWPNIDYKDTNFLAIKKLHKSNFKLLQ